MADPLEGIGDLLAQAKQREAAAAAERKAKSEAEEEARARARDALQGVIHAVLEEARAKLVAAGEGADVEVESHREALVFQRYMQRNRLDFTAVPGAIREERHVGPTSQAGIEIPLDQVNETAIAERVMQFLDEAINGLSR